MNAVVVEKHENPDFLTYHVGKRITDCRILTFESRSWKILDEADENSMVLRFLSRLLGRSAREYDSFVSEQKRQVAGIVADLFRIDGVEYVSIGQHQITIGKGRAFSWGRIDPHVRSVLSQHGLVE